MGALVWFLLGFSAGTLVLPLFWWALVATVWLALEKGVEKL
jgi:hypothetical protein